MPQLDIYILSSQIISIFIFLFFYLLFLKYILPILSFDNKIKKKTLFSFRAKVMVDYLSENGILSKKYKYFACVVNLFDLVSSYIEKVPVTRLVIPYSTLRFPLLLSLRLDEYKENY